MKSVLQALVDQSGGVVTRAVVAQVVPESTLRGACHAGRLLRVLPEVYVDAQLVPPAPADGAPVLARLGPELGRRAVLAYADGRGALSSLSALDVWGLRSQRIGEPVHLDVPAGSGIRTRPHLVVHHRLGFAVAPPHVVYRCGIPVVRLERALVDAWPQLPPADRPAPLIQAANDRLTTPQRVFGALTAAPRLTGRAELRALLVKLAAGCRRLPQPAGDLGTRPRLHRPRHACLSATGTDPGARAHGLPRRYAERERVDFELDGASTHGDRRQREVDLRRDALLATLGILVVRFAHRRLVQETDEVRREILAILASRRGGG